MTRAPRTADDEALRALFARSREDPGAREELVVRYRPLAEGLARRFRGRGDPEDLAQVAMLALLKAVDRFDIDRRTPFAAFATVTIVGELKRHLRDTAWAVHVPRRLQETGLQVSRAVDELSQRLGRSPTVKELAEVTGLGQDEVLDGLEAGAAFEAQTLDAPARDGAAAPREPVDEDESLELLEEWASVADALRALPSRERRILYLRFFRNMSQSAIASELGISQMHVSRLLSRTLAGLRETVGGP